MSERFYLLVFDGDRKGEEILLSAGRFTIGRKEKNDLVLQDTRVSGFHAEVVAEGDDWVLRDLGSTNGTLLDGRKIDEVPLSHGDIFSVGLIRLRFVDREGGPLAEESEEVQVAKVDQDLLQKVGRRSMLPLLLVFLVVAAGGGWALLNLRPEGTGEGGGKPREIPGNLLSSAVASLEEGSLAAWVLDLGSTRFQPDETNVRSGEGALVVDLGEMSQAVLALQEPLSVSPKSHLRAGAFVQAYGETVRVALHMVFYDKENGLEVLRVPSLPGGETKRFQELSVIGTVPVCCDRVGLEVVVTGVDAGATVDDLSIVSAPAGSGVEVTPADYPVSAISRFGPLFAVSQGQGSRLLNLGPVLIDKDKPGSRDITARQRDVVQGATGEDLEVYHPGGESIRVSVKCEPQAEGLTVKWLYTGSPNKAKPYLAWAMPAGLEVSTVAGKGGKGAIGLRLKARADAVLMIWEQPLEVYLTKASGGLQYGLLPIPEGPLTIKVGFRKDQLRSMELLRKAKEKQRAGQPGGALALLRQLLNEVPYDETAVAEARRISAELITAGQDLLRELKEREEKTEVFFAPRELAEVVRQADQILESYREEKALSATAQAIKEKAALLLAELKVAEDDREYQRLAAVSTALGEEKSLLRKLVDDYINKHLKDAAARAAKAADQSDNPDKDN